MSRSPIEILPNVLGRSITSYLPLPLIDVSRLTRTSRANRSIFQPIANELKSLLAVTYGAEEALINLIQRTMKNHPELLFTKWAIKDRGRLFYSVSAYQLMTFLCDDVMKGAIMPLIPPQMELMRQRQYEELGSGGADLIRIDKNPELIKDFQAFREVNTTITIDGGQVPVTFSLLENPDGIIFYQDELNKVHFYYVNQDTKALICLEPEAHTEDAMQALDTLTASFIAMENNSGRRSSDAEYRLIQQTMHITLHREGIRYERDGVCFQDSRTEFRLINKYRTCIRLYDEAEHHGGDWDNAHKFWREEVGNAQGEVMWVLQRICEKGRPFYPLPKNFSGFKRGFAYDNWLTDKDEELVFSNGKLAGGLGKDFCLYKDRGNAGGAGAGRGKFRALPVSALIAVCRLVESAKANVVEEFKPNQGLEPKGAHLK